MIRDVQVNPFSNEIITTALREYNKINYTIPTSANYPDLNPYMYCLFLDEVPFLDDRTNFPLVIKNASETITFTEVMTEPQSQYEFRIAPFGSLRPNCIQFHPSAAGIGIKITYWGMGSVLSYVNYLSKLENLNDLLDKEAARLNLNVVNKSGDTINGILSVDSLKQKDGTIYRDTPKYILYAGTTTSVTDLYIATVPLGWGDAIAIACIQTSDNVWHTSATYSGMSGDARSFWCNINSSRELYLRIRDSNFQYTRPYRVYLFK